MASEYALNLKATLDTKQVQQELQRLKYSYTAGSDDGNSFSKGAPGAAHMQKIEVQLTKLNSAISGLQRSIEQLARQQGKQAIPASPNNIPRSLGMPVALSNTSDKDTILKNLRLRLGPDFDFKRIRGFDGTPERAQFDNALNNVLLADRMKRIPEQKQQQLAQMRQNRQMATMIGGQLFGGAADIARNLGYTDTANILGAAGSGLTAGGGAAMTASMMGAGSAAGPIGMLVGLATVFSTLYSSASDAAAAIQKMSEQMNEAFKTLHQNTLNVQRSVQETRHQTNADMLERTGNIEEARKLAEYWKESQQSLQKQFAESDPLAEERRIRERGEARKRNVDKAMQEGDVSWLDNNLASFLMHLGGGLNVQENAQKAKNEVDRQTAEQIAEMQRKYAAMQQDMTSAQKMQAMYQGVVDKLEGQQKSELAKDAAEVAARLRLSEANDAAIFSYKTRSQLNQTQDFVNGIIDNKSIGALDKFNTIAAELDAARSQKNNALTNAFEIARYLKQNEGTIDSADMQAKQKQQAQYEKEASTIDQRIGILESALTDIQTSTIAPDLSHVTSLAQYGFNMGEKDDSIERMDKYYSKSINLQQQIKDKIEQGIKTEAIYN